MVVAYWLERAALFVTVRARPPSGRARTVTYDGQVYHVPEQESGMTKNSLAIALQLLGLHRSDEDLPKTGAVRFIGQ